MKATEIKAELDTIDNRLAELEEWARTLREFRQRRPAQDDRELMALIEQGPRSGGGLPTDPELSGFADGMDGLYATETEIDRLKDRRQFLEGQLPSPEEVAEAEAEAAELTTQAQDSAERFRKSWGAFLESLEGAEVPGRELVSARAEVESLRQRVARLREDYDLDVEAPEVPAPPQREVKLAGLLGLLLKTVGYSQVIGDTVARDLASVRQKAQEDAA